MAPPRSALDDLLHRINNLLGTIAMQYEVARTLDTHEACRQALRLIQESAQRTAEQVRDFRSLGRHDEP